jgi:hypothetical protein
MATSVTGISLPVLAPVVPGTNVRARRRSISPAAGRALEILGHAIEYLSDEYVNDGGLFSSRDPRLEAIQLLMARNREIYFACPELPMVGERLRSWIHSD